MPYRDPMPRPLRLFYVVVPYQGHIGPGIHYQWTWAKESHEALRKVRKELEYNKTPPTAEGLVICGEDFAEREAGGPPPEEKKK